MRRQSRAAHRLAKQFCDNGHIYERHAPDDYLNLVSFPVDLNHAYRGAEKLFESYDINGSYSVFVMPDNLLIFSPS
jgi:hypothetical protein